METAVKQLFERYERLFNQALAGEAVLDEITSCYASAFVAASPAGVMVGHNDEALRSVMDQGYARYRAIGTQRMWIIGLRFSPLDDLHGVAHVAWGSVYQRPDEAEVRIDFEVHYLVQDLSGRLCIFGWVTGDEQAVLREHGVL